jgi:hypothetical protein
MNFICFSCNVARLAYPEGPAFLDYRDSLSIIAGNLIIFLNSILLLPLLRSQSVKELVETRIKSNQIARQLRKGTRWLAIGAALLTSVTYAVFSYAYTRLFFSPFYAEQSKFQHIVFVASGIASIPFAWAICAQIFGFCGIVLALKMIVFMDLATSFNELDSQIEVVGLEKSVAQGILIQLKDSQLMRFQLAYMDAWANFDNICRRLSKFYLVLWLGWISNTALQLYYSMRSFFGEAHPMAGHDKWSLTLRTILMFLGDAIFLMPFVSSQCFGMLKMWAGRLLFTRPSAQATIALFLNGFSLDFPLGPIRASNALSPYCFALVVIRVVCWACEVYSFHS